jgi:secreted PhoX family phosphatase
LASIELDLTRRDMLRLGGQVALGLAGGALGFSMGCDVSPFGNLREADENGIRLPVGFRSRILARTGDPIGTSGYRWHGAPDGGATFATEHGWIYVSNSELNNGGGAGAITFDTAGRIRDAYRICGGTRRNCAGGATPWGTWLSCEEVRTGWVYECDPTGEQDAIQRPALGRFNHEAVAVDAARRILYLTEDEFSGGLYRFLPNAWPHLESGQLEIAEVYDGDRVRWHPIPDASALSTPTRSQVRAATPFRGGEGIVEREGHAYFTTKFDNRVWDYDAESERISVLYDAARDPRRQLTGVDNIATTRGSELLVAEDGGNMELVIVDQAGFAQPLLRVEGQDASEITGPAFDPRGHRLYFSSQRGTDGRGITYEVRGPFRFGRGQGDDEREDEPEDSRAEEREEEHV